MLTLEELRGDPTIDTVIMAFTDMQGRLMGKRLHRDFFFEQVDARPRDGGLQLPARARHGDGAGCRATRSRRGSAATATSTSCPDLATLRRIPWLEATALVLCDVAWTDGSPVRAVAAAGPARAGRAARALGFDVMVGSELEFYLLRETYEEAHARTTTT